MDVFSGLSILKLSILGLVVGILGSLFGIGGGVIMVPALALLIAMPQKVAQGVSLGVMIPMALMSFIRYCATPGMKIDLKVVLLLAVAAIIGANIGSTVVGQVSNKALQIGFGCLIILVGGWMIIKAVKGL